MKILLLSIYLMFAMTLPTQAFASDLAKLYPQKLAQAKNLYPLALQYFKGPGSLPSGESLTPQMVKSPTRQAAFYKLRRLLGLAIDAGFDLSSLAEFGLVKEEQGYSIDFAKHPQWASMSSLFFEIRKPSDLNTAAYYLRKKGFSQKDIDKLHQYLADNNPYILANLAEQILVKNQSESLKDSNINNSENNAAISKDQQTQTLLKMHKLVKKNKFDTWNMWGRNLLNLFSNYKQRILVSYLQERLGGMAIGGAPISEEYLTHFGDNIRSGKTLQRLANDLVTIKEKANKEYK